MISLKKICSNQSSNIAIKDLEFHNGQYPIFGASGFIKNVDFYKQEKPYIAVVKDGAGVGRVMKLPAKSSIIGTMQYIIPNDNINISYLAYAMENMNLAKYYSGATIPHIYFKDYCKETLPDYTIAEQKQIADTLDKVTVLIYKHKKQLEKLGELVKARFVEMFGDVTNNDKNWHIEPLGNLCDISRGGSPRPIEQYLCGTIPWIKIGDATDGDDIYLTKTKEKILEIGIKKSRLVKSGSLIFANCGVSLGFARIITFDGCIHDGWLSFENIDENLNKIFLLKSLNCMTEYFRSIAPSGTQPNLNTAIMKSYKQIVPPIELQNQFADFVKQIEKTKTQVQKSLEQAETLKKALMQKYFG
ncbi:restriction endonuclease subunit S [Ructibacterium gallinarum]|uniref:Restriction endonuclease subunit S n=1 Tax=Ructibacterium gallinarum TaxID=2779355 RepID=A0A9D5M1R4_9FIRM|nr:restriction endonuclease subunit S [Ructibacterium gallinarum]MBE5041017.1 restriction endonuclease subunit S [Ructibacterium gallinarum]